MKRTELKRRAPLRDCSPAKAGKSGLKATTIRASATRPERQDGQQNITRPITTKPRKPLKQGRSTGRPTDAQAWRLVTIKKLGCICCMLNRERGVPTAYFGVCEAHHLLSGGRRRGHDFTIGLCRWHHQERPPYDMGVREASERFGPSLAGGSKPFHATYGTDDELLAMQNALLAKVPR